MKYVRHLCSLKDWLVKLKDMVSGLLSENWFQTFCSFNTAKLFGLWTLRYSLYFCTTACTENKIPITETLLMMNEPHTADWDFHLQAETLTITKISFVRKLCLQLHPGSSCNAWCTSYQKCCQYVWFPGQS